MIAQPSVEVNVTVAEPAFTAAASGVNTALSVFASGEKLPGPLHVPVLPPAVMDPINGALLPAHIDAGPSAATTGSGVIVSVKASAVFAQEMLLVDVSVMVMLPLSISAALGVYVALRSVIDGENEPVPEELHVPVVGDPETDPASAVVPSAQIVRSIPALVTVTGLISRFFVSETTLHPPVEARVSVTEPAEISAALGA